MLSNEVLKRIGQNAEKTSAILSNFIGEAEKLAALANKTAEEAGEKGATTAIVANELNNIVRRMGQIRNENVRNLIAGGTSSFEMFDKIFALIRCIDEGAFQMNLLRLFCGIETGRISPPKDQFEAVELLDEDIRQEAAKCVEACVREVNKAVGIGDETDVSAHVAAKSLSGRGRVFSYIAKEVSASVNMLKSVTDDLKNLNDLSTALSKIANTAYSMSINGFNASVETAREGSSAECLAATEKIMKYTGVLQTTYHECEVLCSEYERLMELTKRNGRQYEEALTKKHIDDIIFQSRILSSQFALESERINRETFRALTQTAITADTNLVKTRDLAAYRKTIEQGSFCIGDRRQFCLFR